MDLRTEATCWMFAGACLLQPTLITLSFGQVGLVLMWLTVEGLKGQPDSTRRTWLVGAATVSWFLILIVLTMQDYMSRDWVTSMPGK